MTEERDEPRVDRTRTDPLVEAPPGRRDVAAPVPEQIAGFRIIREIGSGGMGTVYEAVDEEMHRRVALKVLSRSLSSSDRAQVRFEREAWIAGRLSHPNLVKVFNRGAWKDVEFLSMELMDGGSLHDVIRNMRRWGKDDRWDLRYGGRDYIAWAIERTIDAAQGLDHAHRQGVIHRDIKPMNILLAKDPFAVKVADFGIALDMEATQITTTGAPLGTIAYMAPEQIEGGSHEVDARADVYSLGVTLFELLTLDFPFIGKTQQLYVNHVLSGEARRVSKLNEKVSRDLDVVVRKALERYPKDRYASAARFAEDLENVLALRPISAVAPSTLTRITRWARRKPIHAALAVALLFGIPTVTTLFVRGIQQQRQIAGAETEETFLAGVSMAQHSLHRDAVDAFSEVLDSAPEHWKARKARALSSYSLARAASDAAERSRLQEATLEDASRLVELMPETSWPYRLRAFILEEFGRSGEAKADDANASRLRSPESSLEGLQLDAILARESGDFERAVDLYSGILTRRPEALNARLERGELYMNHGELTKAKVDFEVAATVAPQDYLPFFQQGRLATMSERFEEADQHYRRALELSPENPHIHTGLAQNSAEHGKARAAEGDYEGARETFAAAEAQARQALALNPDVHWARINLGVALMERYRLEEEPDPALATAAIGEYDRAIVLWLQEGGSPRDEGYTAVLANRCDAVIQTGELDRALEACGAAVDAAPENPVNHYNLAGAHALAGQSDEALASLQRDFELGDQDHEYLASDDWFVSLRGDPRFEELLEEMRAASRSTSQP